MQTHRKVVSFAALLMATSVLLTGCASQEIQARKAAIAARRLKERLTRFPYYVGCRANYARFDVRCCGGSMQWELVDGALKDYSTPPFLSDGEQ